MIPPPPELSSFVDIIPVFASFRTDNILKYHNFPPNLILHSKKITVQTDVNKISTDESEKKPKKDLRNIL